MHTPALLLSPPSPPPLPERLIFRLNQLIAEETLVPGDYQNEKMISIALHMSEMDISEHNRKNNIKTPIMRSQVRLMSH